LGGSQNPAVPKSFFIWDPSPGFVFVIKPSGNFGIGTSAPQYPLSVNGTIQAKEVLVNTGWSDYAFSPDYRLAPLEQVEAYMKANHHVPDIPSETEIKEKGASVGEMESKLLAKIEELTPHMIQEHERNDRLERRNRELEARLVRLETGDRAIGEAK
jgi:hypothetical protein